MSQCTRCGVAFTCAVADGPADTPCWCMQVPALPAATLDDAQKASREGLPPGCLCRACLLALLPAESD